MRSSAMLRDVLRIRAEARALQWAISEFENLPEAVDLLQTFALEFGLIAEIGQDAVQQMIGDAFARYRTGGGLSAADHSQATAHTTPSRRPTPQTTIEAIMWCV